MSDEPQEIIKDGDTVTVYQPGVPFNLIAARSLPEYVFEVTGTERLPDGTLRVRCTRRERRPDDVVNAVISGLDREGEDVQ
jgi:mannose-6-phosphate isomerase-like protein (cupin superfamily)